MGSTTQLQNVKYLFYSQFAKKSTRRGVLFWYDNRNMKGFDGGAANESERCASEVEKMSRWKAQATINNCRAGRAATRRNSFIRTTEVVNLSKRKIGQIWLLLCVIKAFYTFSP